MFRFIAFRLLQLPLILAVIYLLTFALAWVAPGDPFQQTDRRLTKEAEAALRQRFHADSWHQFLLHYPTRIVLYGDFGPSMADDAFDVGYKIRNGLPRSMSLGLIALAMALVGGAWVGALAAIRRGSTLDLASNALAMVGISIPSFVIAALLLTLFYSFHASLNFTAQELLRQWIFPAFTLCLLPMAYIARLMRVSMLDTLTQDFVRTARAKGLKRSTVIWKHCARAACLPVVSFLGPAAAATLTGSFVVETIFDIPGLGRDFVNSVLNRDRTLILGTVMVYSAILVSLNLLVDVLYVVVDPRIDFAAGKE